MPEERTGYPADPPSTGASGGRAHPGCLPRLLSDGDAAASAADAGTWTDTAGSAGNTGRYSNAGRIFSDYRWPPTGHAALHRTESRSGAVAPSSEPRPAATTASAHHDPCLDSPLFPAQNVVETLAVPLLKIKRISALDMPNCEGSVKNEAPVFVKGFAPPQHLLPHLVRRAKRQNLLGVHAAAPENHLPAIFLLQGFRFHAGGRALHGVENIEAGLHERGDEFSHRAAGMLEGLPWRVLVDPVVDLAVIGHPQLAECPDRAERRSLGSEIRPADVHHVHQGAHSRRDALQVRQCDLALAGKHGVHVIPSRARGDIPFGNVDRKSTRLNSSH